MAASQFAVIGLGAFGSEVARSLAKKGYYVVAIDRDPELVKGIRDVVRQAVVADATEPEVLHSLGLAQMDATGGLYQQIWEGLQADSRKLSGGDLQVDARTRSKTSVNELLRD